MTLSNVNESKATLRIASDTLSSRQISDILGISPSEARERGSPYSSRDPYSKARENAVWLLQSTIDPSQPLEAHIESLVQVVEKNIQRFESLGRNFQIDIFCGYFPNKSQ